MSDFECRIREERARVEVGDLPVVQGDPVALQQLFQNLIGNALKFHRKGAAYARVCISGKIIPERRRSSGRTSEYLCQIQVQDWGIGIPEEHFDKIFCMFKRLHASNEYDGVGMGLAVCKKVVEQCGGEISVQSTVGKGSTFTVTLPVEGISS